MAQAAFASFGRDAALADLVEDSLDDPHSDPDERLLVFAGAGLTFRVTAVRRGADDVATVSVDVVPPPGDRLSVHVHGREPWSVHSEAPGRWVGFSVPQGPVSFAVGGPVVVRTSWTRL